MKNIDQTLNGLWSDYKDLYNTHRFIFALIGGTVVYAVFFFISWTRLDPDFGWHLATGNHILTSGIPRKGIFSYTAVNHSWIDHEWGNDLILAILYNIGGYLLSAAFFAILWTSALMIMGWRRRVWVLFIAALAITPYAGIRPVAWSVFLFAVVLRIIQSKNKKWRWILPLIFLPWANLHAGFIAGLALIIYFAVIEMDLKLLAILLLSGALTLINPYGTSLYLEVARTIFDPVIHNQIIEWSSFLVVDPSKPYIALWIIGFILFEKPRWRRFIGLGPLLLITALIATRNLPFFIVATVGNFDQYVTDIFKRVSFFKLKTLNKFMYLISITLSISVLVFVIVVAFFPLQNRFTGYPVKEVAYLKQHSCNGNLFNDYNYGGFLIWKLPGVPDYIDGRMVTWIDHMNTYLKVMNDPQKYYYGQFSKYDIRCALLSQKMDYKLYRELLQHNWKVVVRDQQGGVLLKQT